MNPDLNEFLCRLSPGFDDQVNWADGTMPLRMTGYCCDELPPEGYISSVRSIVRRGDSVLVCRNRDGRHVLPGGRIEVGESLREALDRELLEETGWRVAGHQQIGFIHFQHLAPKPPGYRFPFPDFIMLVSVADAVEFFPGVRIEDDYEVESDFVRLSDLVIESLEPCSRFFVSIGLCGENFPV